MYLISSEGEIENVSKKNIQRKYLNRIQKIIEGLNYSDRVEVFLLWPYKKDFLLLGNLFSFCFNKCKNNK